MTLPELPKHSDHSDHSDQPEQTGLTNHDHFMAKFRELCQSIPDLEKSRREQVRSIEEHTIAAIQETNAYCQASTATIETRVRDMMNVGVGHFGYPAEEFEAIAKALSVKALSAPAVRKPLQKLFKNRSKGINK